MVDYVTISGTEVQFKTNEFLKVQWQIAGKYDKPESYSIRHHGMKKLAERMDNFYARINGEIAEVYRELFNKEISVKELVKESVDVIMYLGSQNMLVDYNLITLAVNDYDYNFSFHHVHKYYEPFEDYALKIMAHVHEINTRIIEMYPVEWHEKMPEYNEIIARNILEDTAELMTDIMQYIISMLLDLTKADADLINDCIHEKQERALARKPV
jgi:hypothetical protein